MHIDLLETKNLAIRKAKKDYCHNIITANTHHMWSLLKTILPSKINTSRLSTNLTVKIFNMCSSTIGQELTKNVTTADTASSIKNKTSSCNKFQFQINLCYFHTQKNSLRFS